MGMTGTLHTKPGSRSRFYSQSRTAKVILRDTIYSLLETGLTKQDIVAALKSLADEARNDAWQKVLDGRERARRRESAAAARAMARRRGEVNI
jgi:hypothetical protein